MGRFEQVWSGAREPRSCSGSFATAGSGEHPAVASFRAWTERLMAGARVSPSVYAINLRKLRLTEGYREALRQAPGEQILLHGIWDAAYRTLEALHWELAPPAIDPPPPPPPPTFAEVRAQYKAMKREQQRRLDDQRIHWHPLGVNHDPISAPEPDPLE